ncbi:MAG: YbaN family protein [Treponema sp.]|nr:YbaN family protein [Treponema sp.]
MKILKTFWIIAGIIFTVLGSIGVPLPLLPTTPFLLLAAFCFAKGSRKMEIWFRNTWLYKKYLENFIQERAMTLKAKLCILIPVSLMMIFAFVRMCQKDNVGTRIGRVTVVIILILKYVYFFTKIKTIKIESKIKE